MNTFDWLFQRIRWFRAIFNCVKSYLGLLCFCITSLCDWSSKFASLTLPIRCKTKTTHDLVVAFFPLFWQFGCFYFDFSLALKGIFLFFWLLWFQFYNTVDMRDLSNQSKVRLQPIVTWSQTRCHVITRPQSSYCKCSSAPCGTFLVILLAVVKILLLGLCYKIKKRKKFNAQ